mmetsp:Transcript_4404/g.8833  ORF Transcript_4404/g.8833 Transcript_4404/m.8833 type:complete len:322 (-) Transcript_4404:216-1181(-)|eukprot:CAMPEP_0172670168 /NCGR_PEP_ID=MMETSP1074-20121228/10135_1 /TAXON_ID=2916 /ORGANISM="Ceratium fusus, Strain PA161109" /LENGTH=321 /DNA_ID=CAMNT_0013487041 /DNA_START=48 /DNA_END=1013 /DNA_ORIENTATION=-
MSTARYGKKWADVDEEDDDDENQDQNTGGNTRFETQADKDGIKTVIEYLERDGKTYKVTSKVKQTSVKSWTNKNMIARKNMAKFGKPMLNEAAESHLCVKSEEDVMIELTRKPAIVASIRDDAEEKFYQESLDLGQTLQKEKKTWTDMNRARQLERDEKGVGVEATNKPETGGGAGGGGSAGGGGGAGLANAAESAAAAAAAAAAGGPGRYVPPSLRNAAPGGKGDGKGGKGDWQAQQQEASLRITNLSEDCKEGDLQDLFGKVGRLQRVYLAKDQTTGESRGFAFVTYGNKVDAQRAIDQLNGHGYDNLILQVQFAKPRV